MNVKELKSQYDKLVSEIETKEGYDGRGQGIDVYVCEKCGERFYTKYKDKGVTPFTIRCRKCGKGTAVHKKTISEGHATLMDVKIHNWVRPTFEQLQTLSEGAIEHVLNGGIMLEDELDKKKDVVKERFRHVQEILETLQHEDATCLFIGDEGNIFVIIGNPSKIAAQIVFAMIRYPVVKEIINYCADKYEILNKKFGEEIRNVPMEHLVEQNSGN